MINPFKGLGDITKMQQQARQMQQALQQEEITVEKDGIRVVLRGDQQVREVEIDGVLDNRVADAINEAVKKTQELAARKLLEMTQQE
jgi:DNA-binding protein YbaB